MTKPALHAQAPDFTLPATGAKSVKLSDFKGKNVILYFYPKDDTSGCTQEACDFSAALPNFSGDAVVIGVSKDSVEAHEKFKAKYKIAFDLASDKDANVCETYGVWAQKSMYGKTYMGIERTTYLIDKHGKIARIWPKVKVTGHAQDVLAALAGIS